MSLMLEISRAQNNLSNFYHLVNCHPEVKVRRCALCQRDVFLSQESGSYGQLVAVTPPHSAMAYRSRDAEVNTEENSASSCPLDDSPSNSHNHMWPETSGLG